MDQIDDLLKRISPRSVGKIKSNARIQDIPVPQQEKTRTDTGIGAYSGNWGKEEAAHLLRRTTFGANSEMITQALSLGREAVVDLLLQDLADPNPPVYYAANTPIGETWVNEEDGELNGERLQSLYAWWTGLMVNGGLNITEKMVLFLHNHYVTESETVNDARYLYKYTGVLRSNALGNFKEITKDITRAPAMLWYLNGNQNFAGAPNENYARELFELFTIGKGPQIGEGNYTNYTEQDVLAAARVLTGYYDDYQLVVSRFWPGGHDKEDKVFSEAFDNQVITNQENTEYSVLIDMIFSKQETARNLCRELYRWFVFYDIDENVEANVIEPLSQIMFANDYEIKPVLRALLNSEHFYDFENRGGQIKNPLDLTLNPFIQFNVPFADPSDIVLSYTQWYILYQVATIQDMQLGNPPSVAGWPAYYQEPAFQRIWINAAVLPFKQDFINFFIYDFSNEFELWINPIPVAESIPNADDPNILIQELIDIALPIDLNQSQKDFLKEVLIPGLPDFEWTIEWNDYLADPENPEKFVAVGTKLQALFSALLTIAEYQLS